MNCFSFVHLSARGLPDYLFFGFVLQYVCTYLVKSQCYFSNYFKKIISSDHFKAQIFPLSLYFGLVCALFACLFFASMYV